MSLPIELANKTRIYGKDLPAELRDAVWEQFKDGIAPLHSSGKLGAVFLQYPRWFFPSNESRDAIVEAQATGLRRRRRRSRNECDTDGQRNARSSKAG